MGRAKKNVEVEAQVIARGNVVPMMTEAESAETVQYVSDEDAAREDRLVSEIRMITEQTKQGIRMMLYRFEVDYTVPGKMGSKNYVTAVAATDAAHARVEAGKIFEGLKEDYGYDKALGKLYSASGICKCIAEFNEPVAQMSKA